MTTDKLKELDLEYDLVFIIDCLPEKERENFQISQDLMAYLANNGIHQTTSICSNKKLVLATFEHLKILARSDKKFCIHFVSHGDKNGLWVKSTDEDILWHDFKKHLKEINEILGGTLTVNMTSCFGLHGINIVDPNSEELPFFGLIGYSKELEVSQGKRINELFYTKLLENKKINEAVDEIKNELNDTHLFCISSEGFKVIKNKKIS